MKSIGIYAFEIVSADVIVTVTGGRGKALGADAVLLHRVQHLRLIAFRRAVDRFKARLQIVQHSLAELVNLRANPEHPICSFNFHRKLLLILI